MNTSSPQRAPVQAAVTAIRSLVFFDAVIFLSAAMLHLGLRISLGPIVLVLGRIIPATMVEGLIGVLSLVTAYALVARKVWALGVAMGAHVFALAGVLVGLRAVMVGSSPYKALNVGYHELMLAAVVAGLILLLIPGVRATLERAMNGRVVKVTHG